MTLLKRYSNRRLYDTRTSRFITLEELAERIRKGEDFSVVDARTGEDLTRKVLMQIVVLESLEIADLLPMEFLQTLIRVQDRHLQELFVRSLKLSLDAFSVAQRQLEDNLRLVHGQLAATGRLVRALVPFRRERRTGAGSREPEGGPEEFPEAEPDEASEAIPVLDERLEDRIPPGSRSGA